MTLSAICPDSTIVIAPGHSTCRTQAQPGGEHDVNYPVLYDNVKNVLKVYVMAGVALSNPAVFSELGCIMLDLDGMRSLPEYYRHASRQCDDA